MSLLVDLRILQPQIVAALRDRVLANRERQRRQNEIRAAREESIRQRTSQEQDRQQRRQGGELLPSRFRPDDPAANQPGYPVAQIIASRVGNTVNLRCVLSDVTASFSIPADTLITTGAVPANLQEELPDLDWQTRTLEELGLPGSGNFQGLVGGSADLDTAAAFIGVDFALDTPITPPGGGTPFLLGDTFTTTEVQTETAHVCLFCLLPVRARTAVFVASTYAQITEQAKEQEYAWTATTYDSSVDPGGFVVFGTQIQTLSTTTTNETRLDAHNCYVFNDAVLREIPAPGGLVLALDTYYASGDYASLEGSLVASYGITYRTNVQGGFDA